MQLEKVMSLTDFIDKTKEHQLTIEKWVKLPVGTIVTLVSFDRNIYDMVYKIKKPIDIHDFFDKCTKLEIEKINGNKLGGPCTIYCGGEAIDSYDFMELDIFLEKHNLWYPVSEKTGTVILNSMLTTKISQKNATIITNKHWSSYDPQTLLGWRGECLEIKYLDELGVKKIYCDECS